MSRGDQPCRSRGRGLRTHFWFQEIEARPTRILARRGERHARYFRDRVPNRVQVSPP